MYTYTSINFYFAIPHIGDRMYCASLIFIIRESNPLRYCLSYLERVLRQIRVSSYVSLYRFVLPLLQDPDAPYRLSAVSTRGGGGGKLDPLDADDDERLVRNVFSLIRAGQLEQAQQLCSR